MAINLIQIDTGSLGNTVSNMSSDTSSLQNEINLIYQDIQELDAMWDGPANTYFNQQFEKDRQDFITICGDIDEYISKLEEARIEYNKCELKVSDIVNSIRV